jgi:transcriptional regulator with XRE-family HTH domain
MMPMKDNHPREVGFRLKTARERKGLTQVQLGEKLGVVQGTVAHWENGRRRVSAKRASEISLILDITANNLLYGEEQDSSPSEVPSSGSLLDKALVVLNSKTIHTDALTQNIEAFYHAVLAEKVFENRLSLVESKLKRISIPPPEGQPSGKENISKKEKIVDLPDTEKRK